MKFIFLFLSTSIQTVFLYAQTDPFDPVYFGQYKTENDAVFYSFNEYEGDLDQYLTKEQKKNVVFFFSCQNTKETFAGVAMRVGNTYKSQIIKEITPEVTFAFNSENDLPTVVVTDKSGQKVALTKIDFTTYFDEEDISGNPEDVRMYSQIGLELNYYENGKVAMYVTFKSGIPHSVSMIFDSPDPDDDEVIILEGILETTETPNQFIFNDETSGNRWKVYEIGPDFSFECIEGDCYDKNEKSGLWKEPFHFVQ